MAKVMIHRDHFFCPLPQRANTDVLPPESNSILPQLVSGRERGLGRYVRARETASPPTREGATSNHNQVDIRPRDTALIEAKLNCRLGYALGRSGLQFVIFDRRFNGSIPHEGGRSVGLEW